MKHSIEAEMGVLGSCLLSGRALEECKSILLPEDFYRPAHRIIWRVMLEMYDIGLYAPDGIDFLILKDRLGDELAEVGGEDYLLAVAESTPSPANAEMYAQTVSEDASVRRIHGIAKEIQAAAQDGAESDELLSLARKFEDAKRFSTHDLTPWCEIEVTGRETGVTTGHAALDACTGVGFVRGQLSVVSAFQKGGKTALLVDAMVGAAEAGKNVCYATFADLDPVRLKRRALKNSCGFGGPPSGPEGFEAYDAALRAMNDPKGMYGRIVVYDARKHGKNIESFVGKISSYARKNGLDAVYCDYAQKITARTVQRSERTAQLEFISEQLDELAQKTGIAVVAGSQVSRREGVGWVTQYSVSLEQDAGLVLRISKDAEDERIRVIDVPYNRFGKEATLYGDWDERTVRIVNVREAK